MTTDAELVEAYREGNQRAGKELVARYYGRVLGFFRNKAPSRCHDLAQRTFLGCFEGMPRLRDPSRFRSFVFATAANQLRKHYDQTRREDDRIDYGSVSSADLDPSPSRIAVRREEQRVLLEGLRRIPLDHQIVLELFFWEQMTAAEIAEALGIALGTVKTRIRTGRKRLEEALLELKEPQAVLEATKSDLEGWATQLREQVLAGRRGE